ncbi:hypothetical protein GRI65_05485 [Altererythrobacter sediminis]|uniref:Uncharacterized protein n=1 Tax=Allopontixanthobacter sediminis TaxID=1689985 RepID=A0A845B398_9SPHN|nr:hypothetical protein [Allopontixanthobacter sediminis]
MFSKFPLPGCTVATTANYVSATFDGNLREGKQPFRAINNQAEGNSTCFMAKI